MVGKNFSVTAQRVKYIVTDFVMVSVAFMLFDIFRYLVFASHNAVETGLPAYLAESKLLMEQLIIPASLFGNILAFRVLQPALR